MKAYKEILNTYINGNYCVRIYDDGSKVRLTLDDEFEAIFPESIDLKITNYCDNNCPMCHENSSIEGKHANLDYKFLKNLHPGTELAIGGGNPLSHPDLEKFLLEMKDNQIICNITINQKHFLNNQNYIQYLIDNKLIYGLGLSIIDNTNLNEIIEFASINKNVVIHLIAGLIDLNLLEKLYNKHLKILILGYKSFGRGVSFLNESITKNIEYLKNNIIELSSNFFVVSFDNLAIKQLDLANRISKEDYEKYYMGDDGKFTMYIDLVKKEFAKSSITSKRFNLLDNIESMFKIVKEN